MPHAELIPKISAVNAILKATNDEHYYELERLLRESWRWTQKQIAEELEISRPSVVELLQRGVIKKEVHMFYHKNLIARIWKNDWIASRQI